MLNQSNEKNKIKRLERKEGEKNKGTRLIIKRIIKLANGKSKIRN